MTDNEYARRSIQEHLFFDRIIKEHAYVSDISLGVQYVISGNKFTYFTNQFDGFLNEAIALANGSASADVLASEELVTPHTVEAESKSINYTNEDINIKPTIAVLNFTVNNNPTYDETAINAVNDLNVRVMQQLIEFNKYINTVYIDIVNCNIIFASQIIIHFITEANFYYSILNDLQNRTDTDISDKINLNEWNTFMIEHSQSLMQIIDWSKPEGINTSSEFLQAYNHLLQLGGDPSSDQLSLLLETQETTTRFAKFKNDILIGFENCDYIINFIPIWNDHILREANYYNRLLNAALSQPI